MRYLIGICFLWVHLSVFSQQKGSQELAFDLLHSRLEITPLFATERIQGQATLWLKPYFYPQNQVILDAKGMVISEVRVKGKKSTFQYNDRILTIPLGRQVSRFDTLEVSVSYLAGPDLLKKAIPSIKSTDRGLYFVDADEKQPDLPTQLWTQGETHGNSCWFPTLDSPNQKHTQEVILKVEDRFETLSNGLLKSRKKLANGQREDTWILSQPHAVYLTMIAVGEWEKIPDQVYKGHEIAYYVEKKYASSAQAIFGKTGSMIRFFEFLTGTPFPWPGYAQIVAREFVTGAMENTGATVHGDFILKSPNQLVDQDQEDIIAHELFHQWFGNLVTCESWSHLAVNESFADYSEYLWKEASQGKEAAEWISLKAWNQYLEESKEKQVPILRFDYGHPDDMFDAHSYAKGGRILHLLRHEVGDDAFFTSMQRFLSRFRYQTAEMDDYRRVVEEVTGRDLKWFFDQWMLQPGHPKLQVEVTQSQILVSQLDSSRVYQLPITCAVWNGQNWQFIQKRMLEQRLIFDLPQSSTPPLVILDPFHVLPAEIQHPKSKDELILQLEKAPRFRSRLESLQKLTASEDTLRFISPLQDSTIRSAVLSALKDSSWVVRQLAVQTLFDYDGEDFLKVEKALQQVIRFDPHALVRADAILAVKNFMNAQNEVLFRAALEDSAWVVQGAALEAILMNNPADATELMALYKNRIDVHSWSALANYYVNQRDVNQHNWILATLPQFPESDLYPIMGLYASYLTLLEPSEQKRALPWVRKWLLTSHQPIIRYGAFQIAYQLADLPEFKALVTEAKKQETDPRLTPIFNQIPD
ncbi:MAG: M1 family aminopeptidase [Spirosomataceae bacterium]